jgi:histone acetyltransferase (RNA polymerase elongator complex component)
VAFFGGTFTALPRHVQEGLLQPLQPLLASGTVQSIRVSTRPDHVGTEDAAFLRRMGVTVVELGIQSMADDVLEASGRGHTAAQVERAIAVLQQAGLLWGAQLMPGLPCDTPAKAMASLERVILHKPHCLRIYPTLVVRNTPLAGQFEGGVYKPLSMSEAVRLCMAMLHRSWQADLPVIRMGLQPSADLNTPGTVLAGPYHPAFRYLVESELCFALLRQLCAGIPRGTAVAVTCAPSRVSTIIGHKRANVLKLEKLHGVRVDKVHGDASLSPFIVQVHTAEQHLQGHLVDQLDARQFLCFE